MPSEPTDPIITTLPPPPPRPGTRDAAPEGAPEGRPQAAEPTGGGAGAAGAGRPRPGGRRGGSPTPVARGDRTPITVAPLARVEAPRPWWRRRPRRSPALVFVASLLVTIAATALVAWTGRRGDAARFENAWQSASDRVRTRLETYEALLEGTAALFAASDQVTASEFAGFVGRLDLPAQHPGVRGIGFSRWLNPGDPTPTPQALAAALAAGGSPARQLSPATPRAEYHAIVFIEPLDARNRAALGYDMTTDAVRREAMDRARDTGAPAASGAVTLKQEITAEKQRGFLLYVPVYRDGQRPTTVAARRRTLVGFVYAPFRAGDLFAGIFGSERAPRVAFRVFDGPDTTGVPLADSRALPGEHGRADALFGRGPVQVHRLMVAGRPWTMVFTPPHGGGPGQSGWLAAGIAVGGVLVSALLAMVTAAEVRARERAQRSEAMRGRFFAAMSHELRTPINAILGYNDLLLAGLYGELPAEQRHGVQRSQRAARHLLELVNDVLDLSKLEAGKVEIAPEPVRLDELLDDLLATIRPMADERGCELRMERPGCALTIETDPRRLRQILLNLLSNATKFGAGRPVEVRCRPLPRGAAPPGGRRRTADDAVVISVTDRGAGIATADQERIFEEFVQLPGATSAGTGLGLPISRRLAELLGGRLTITSVPGEGACFAVTIPVRRP